MKVEIELPEDAIWKDLLWHVEHAETKKMRKALELVASYYMTYEESLENFGQEKTEKMWAKS